MKIDGRQISNQILDNLRSQITAKNLSPKVVIFYNPDHAASNKYAALKKTVGGEIGVNVVLQDVRNYRTTADLKEAILELYSDEPNTGVMVQLPMQEKFDTDQILQSINSSVDVDVLNLQTREIKTNLVQPVAGAVIECLNYVISQGYHIDHQEIHIIGQGYLVGLPVKSWFESHDIKPKIYVKGDDLNDLKTARVIIAGAGAGHIIKPSMIQDGVILIDAGTSSDSGQLIGDIDPSCYEKSSFYTPVPGGIGPITLAVLMRNIVSAAKACAN